MTSLTQRYSEIAGNSRKLENQAQHLTSDVANLRNAIRNMNEALDQFSQKGPNTILRRAAEDIRQNGVIIPNRPMQSSAQHAI
jgi:DNA anti-recombination protein RmuC